MQSIDYFNNLQKIWKSLHLDEIHQIVQKIIEDADRKLSEKEIVDLPRLLIESQGQYQILTSDEAIRKSADSVMLNSIYNAEMITKIITAVSTTTNTNEINTNPKRLKDFYFLFDRLEILQQLLKSLFGLFIVEKLPKLGKTKDMIELEIINYDDSGMPLDTVMDVISCTSEIYSAFCEVMGMGAKSDELRIAFIDSGSGINISFVGTGEVIKEIKNMIMEFWDKIRFLKYDMNAKEMGTIMDALKVNQVVADQVKSRALDRDSGARITRTIFKNLSSVIGNGALLKDISGDTSPVNNKKLLLEKRKLLLLESGEKARRVNAPKKGTSEKRPPEDAE